MTHADIPRLHLHRSLRRLETSPVELRSVVEEYISDVPDLKPDGWRSAWVVRPLYQLFHKRRGHRAA